jgi:hypothetical protein
MGEPNNKYTLYGLALSISIHGLVLVVLYFVSFVPERIQQKNVWVRLPQDSFAFSPTSPGRTVQREKRLTSPPRPGRHFMPTTLKPSSIGPSVSDVRPVSRGSIVLRGIADSFDSLRQLFEECPSLKEYSFVHSSKDYSTSDSLFVMRRDAFAAYIRQVSAMSDVEIDLRRHMQLYGAYGSLPGHQPPVPMISLNKLVSEVLKLVR